MTYLQCGCWSGPWNSILPPPMCDYHSKTGIFISPPFVPITDNRDAEIVHLMLEIEELKAEKEELQQEINRHHKDFSRWEEMADKGASQINNLQKQSELIEVLIGVLRMLQSWDMIQEGSWLADAKWARDLIDDTLQKYYEVKIMNDHTCDVIPCQDIAIECHGGEIYFCQYHYEGAAAAQKAGIPVEKAYVYKHE